MQTKNISGNSVLFSELKLAESRELQEILDSKILQDFLQGIDDEVLVVLGGDGSMLEAIQQNYIAEQTFFGINFGSKGFLMNDASIISQSLELEEREYPLLEMCIDERLCAVAFNEFDIKAGDGKMLDVDISVGNTHHLSLMGDGIIVSTPAGSTGYNSSLGGPILPHDLPSYIITAKAPWKPKGLAPIILSDSETLSIQTQGRQSPVELYADGRLIEKYDHENISLSLKKSSIAIKILISAEQSSSWDFRVLEEQGFSKKVFI